MRRALIVGAGIGGLAAAVSLRKAGWQVRIFERAASPRELGFALNLAPNAMAALTELGLADRIRSAGSVLREVEVRDGHGRLLRRTRMPEVRPLDLPGVIALRPVIHGALLDALASDASSLELAATAAGFRDSADGVELRLAGGRSERGDVLIGADGVGSIIRQHLHPHEAPPRPSGYWAIRGAALSGGPELGDVDALVHLGDGVESAAVRAGGTAVYWYFSLLAADLDKAERDPAAIAAERTRTFDARFRSIVEMTDEVRLDELFERDPLAGWGAGGVTLLGDAAHPMLPHSGQGAAQALEDSVALGLALSSPGDVAAALRRYERVRAARTATFVKFGRRMARIATTHNHLIRILRDTATRLTPGRLMAEAMQPPVRRDPHAALRAGVGPSRQR